MERKTFILLSTLGGCSLCSPMSWYGCEPETPDLALGVPQSLLPICDSDTLQSIGRAYVRMNPSGNDIRSLAASITRDLPESDAGLKEQLRAQISKEFETGRVLEIDGWLLSLTEARQCALYFLLKS